MNTIRCTYIHTVVCIYASSSVLARQCQDKKRQFKNSFYCLIYLPNRSTLGFVWLQGHITALKAVVVLYCTVCTVILKGHAVMSMRRWHYHTLYMRFQSLLPPTIINDHSQKIHQSVSVKSQRHSLHNVGGFHLESAQTPQPEVRNHTGNKPGTCNKLLITACREIPKVGWMTQDATSTHWSLGSRLALRLMVNNNGWG